MATPRSAATNVPDIEAAFSALRQEMAWNEWFLTTCLPENEARARRMIADVLARRDSERPALLDIGCFNGWMSLLFARLGYEVTATDASEPEDGLFAKHGIRYFRANLNDPAALRSLDGGTFDAVIMGEVIEHVLNHPLGLMKEVARVLKPRGVLLLTTPNPATAMNAWRTLRNTHSLWGTPEFMSDVKIESDRIISRADIHYREYRDREVRWLLEQAGFTIEETRFMPIGAASSQSRLNRFIKRAPLLSALLRTRLLGSTQYHVARRT